MTTFLAAAVLAISAAASAQYSTYGGYSYSNPVTATVSNMVWEGINARLVYKMGLKRKGFTEAQLSGLTTAQLREAYATGRLPSGSRPAAAPQPPPQAGSPGSVPATRFKQSGTRVLMPLIVDSLTEDPMHRKALKDVFSQSFAAFEAEAKKNGLQDDVAVAVATFAAAAFQLHDGKAPSDEATVLLAKAIQIGADNSRMRQLTDLEKQKFYEFMVTMASYLVLASAELKTEADKPAREGLKDAAAGVLKAFLKIDPAKVRLTEAGFEKR